jgi:O-antigen ligase
LQSLLQSSSTALPRRSGLIREADRRRSAARIMAATGRRLALSLAAALAGITHQGVHRIGLVIVLLDIPLQIDSNLGYLAGADEFGGIAGFNVSLTTLALAVLYFRWAILALTRRADRSRTSWRVVLPLVVYVGFAGLSVFAAGDRAMSARELFLLCQTLLLYLYLVYRVRGRDEVMWILRWLVVGLVIESSLMLVGAYRGESFSLPGLNLRPDRGGWVFVDAAFGGRVGGTVGSPNGAAAYLSVMLTPALCLMLLSKGIRKLPAIAGLVLGIMAIVTTQSRGGWTATLVSFAVFYGVLAWRGRVSVKAPLIAGALVAIALLAMQDTIVSRLTEDDNGSAQSRLPLMRTAMQMIADHPVFGVGANNYSVAMKRYGAVYGDWGEWVFTVHNKYALVWAETGLGGIAAFIWFLAASMRRGLDGARGPDPLMSTVSLAFAAALAGHLIHLSVDLFSERPQVQLLWTVAALITVVRELAISPATPVNGLAAPPRVLLPTKPFAPAADLAGA